MSEVAVKMPKKMLELFQGDYRYRVAYGGRGSGKTRTFAMMAAWKGYMFAKEGRKGQILCGREHLNSLEESSFTEIKGAIESDPILSEFYICGARYIRTKCGSVDFSFAGLRLNVASIKSKSRILLTWLDEAEEITEEAYRTLLPTVREEGSEIWISFNPKDEDSATYRRFVDDPPENAIVRRVNYSDNPYFPQVLKDELELDRKRLKPEVFAHVWEGACLPYFEGSYYRAEMLQAEQEGRLMDHIHLERTVPVITAWDLGMSDSTAIVFAQHVGSEIRIIDYYENHGKALDHYVQMLRERAAEKGYVYGTAVLPHDVKVRELGTGKSRLEILDGLGLRDTTVTPQIRVDDGIAAVRLALSRCYFDMGNCKELVRYLRHYHNEYDEKARVFKSKPAHDFSSHGADATRYLITGYRDNTSWGGADVRRGSDRFVA